MTDDELRAVVRMANNAIERRARPLEEKVDEALAWLAHQEEEISQIVEFLRNERIELNNLELDAMAGGDDGVFWQGVAHRDMPPDVVRKLREQHGYGQG